RPTVARTCRGRLLQRQFDQSRSQSLDGVVGRPRARPRRGRRAQNPAAATAGVVMAGAPKDLEALWRRHRAIRKKARGGKLVREELKHLPPEVRHRPLSPQEFRSLPPQLRLPLKLHGFGRPQGLRGPALVQWVMLLGGICRDKRFDDFINALFEHGIVDSRIYEIDDPSIPAQLAA